METYFNKKVYFVIPDFRHCFACGRIVKQKKNKVIIRYIKKYCKNSKKYQIKQSDCEYFTINIKDILITQKDIDNYIEKTINDFLLDYFSNFSNKDKIIWEITLSTIYSYWKIDDIKKCLDKI